MSGEAAVGAAGRSSQALVCVSPPDTRGGRGAGAVGEGEGASTRRQRPAGQHEDQKTRLPRPGVGCSSLSLLPLRCVCFGCAPAYRRCRCRCRRLGEVKGFVIASVREREEGRSAASLSLFSLCSPLHWFLFYPPVLFDLRVGPLLSFFLQHGMVLLCCTWVSVVFPCQITPGKHASDTNMRWGDPGFMGLTVKRLCTVQYMEQNRRVVSWGVHLV
jgi:hypothetical protein